MKKSVHDVIHDENYLTLIHTVCGLYNTHNTRKMTQFVVSEFTRIDAHIFSKILKELDNGI